MRVAAKHALVATLVALLGSSAAAESPADVAFKRGRELFKSGDYPAACEQFAKSQELDPQLGTLFNLSQCDEKIGKLSTALRGYREVARKDTNAERRTFAADLAKKVAGRVPKVIIQIAGKPEGLVVRLDDRTIPANAAIELDNGDYTLTVQAAGMHDVSTQVHVSEEGRTITIVVPLTPKTTSEAAKPTQTSEVTGMAQQSNRKMIGIVTLVVGGATIATGGVFGSLAMSGWKDAKDVCGGMVCSTTADADRANSLRDKALSRAMISNVLFGVGGALALTGIILWATAPSAESNLSVSGYADDEGASVMFSGHF